MYEFVMDVWLCFWEDKAAVVGVEDGVFAARSVEFGIFSLDDRRLVVDFVVDLGQERRRGCSEPPAAAELERPEMAAPISGAEYCIWVLLELLERDRSLGRDLHTLLVEEKNEISMICSNPPDHPQH